MTNELRVAKLLVCWWEEKISQAYRLEHKWEDWNERIDSVKYIIFISSTYFQTV